jgi:hypothetical protein
VGGVDPASPRTQKENQTGWTTPRHAPEWRDRGLVGCMQCV